jgi:hypothetical protein
LSSLVAYLGRQLITPDRQAPLRRSALLQSSALDMLAAAALTVFPNTAMSVATMPGPGSSCAARRGRVQAIITPSHVAEDVMAAQRKWSDLSEGTRKLIVVAVVADSILKGAALIDIKRRPADQIRGPKWLWAPVVAVVNSAGVVPISYFVFGRRGRRGSA